VQSPAASFITDIVGAQAVLDGRAKSVSGVVARGNKLTVRLTKVAPDFVSRIAMPFFCAIPTTTPIDPKGVRSIASAGPYYVSSYTPNRRIVLLRNPNYHGPRPHNLQRIDYTVGVNSSQGLLQIKAGQADYAVDGVPPAANAELGRNFGSDSAAAKEGKQQYFVNPVLAFRYLALNTERPLFKDVKLRKAVNYAIDRGCTSAPR
jgi:peptide/nickel transport system substrate-binding protein